jgi:hypothetical protein
MNKIAVERWSGKAWYPVMLSPFKTMGEVTKFLKDYHWHFTQEYPYRIKDFKPKKKVQRYVPKYKNWNDEDQYVVSY